MTYKSFIKNPVKLQELAIINAFVILQFFLQGAVGVLSKGIKESYGLDAASLSVLSSSFFTFFILLQIPAGILLDRWSFRKILTCAAFLVGSGCLFWAFFDHFLVSVLSRALMGAGSAFSYIGLLKNIKSNFSSREFAFILSVSECASFVGVALANNLASSASSLWGWRFVIGVCGFLAILISICIYYGFKEKPREDQWPQKAHSFSAVFDKEFQAQLFSLLRSGKVWLLGLYAGLSNSVVTVFVALWAIPYYIKSYRVLETQATSVVSMIYLGMAIASPVIGLASRRVSVETLIQWGTGLAFLILTMSLYISVKPFAVLYGLLFFSGVTISVYQLSFAIVAQMVPDKVQGTAMGLTNMLAMMGGLLLQPFIGLLLSYRVGGAVFDGIESYTIEDYRVVLGVLPICILIAFCLSLFFKDPQEKLFQSTIKVS